MHYLACKKLVHKCNQFLFSVAQGNVCRSQKDYVRVIDKDRRWKVVFHTDWQGFGGQTPETPVLRTRLTGDPDVQLLDLPALCTVYLSPS